MRAAIFEGPEKIRVGEWPTPSCKPGEILVKVSYCAICGTDVRTFFHGHKKVVPPAVIGHEIAGEVVEIGSSASGAKKGYKVTVVTSLGCGVCKLCQGDFTTSARTPKRSVMCIPAGSRNTSWCPDSR